MLTEFKITLGSKVKCRITGYEGIVIGRSQWLHGCNTYTVKSKELREGKPIDSVHFDEAALDVVKLAKPREEIPDNGGPREAPGRTYSSPKR